MRSTRAQAPQNGFTLVEVVLATVVLSVILLGMHSAMMLAWRASPERDSANSASLAAGTAMDLVTADLTYATSITSAIATSIDFVVPDRTGDGAPDTIRYSWSGTSGNPLLRVVNGSAGVAVATNVTEFQLLYHKRPQLQTTTYSESGEVLLSYYDGATLPYLNSLDVDSSNFVGQYFKPSLPASATHWRVTRASLRARYYGQAVGDSRVQVRTAVGNTPGAILDEITLNESLLNSSFSWREFTFNNAPWRAPGTGLCLVVQWNSGLVACQIEYQGLLASASNRELVKTSNSGATWSSPIAQNLRFYVYGTYKTPNPATYSYWLTGVSGTLRCGADPVGRVQTSIRVLNEPQVSGP